MTSTLSGLPPGARVAVLRLRSLGDCVLTTPALRLLKATRPDLRLAIVVESRFAEVFHGNPDIDALLPPAPTAIIQWRPQLVLNFHGGTRSMILTAVSGARFRAGFAHHRGAALYNIRIPTAQQIFGFDRKVHTAEHLASAIFYLGAERQPIPRARLFTAASSGCSRPTLAIHPFAATPEKTWPAEKFLKIAARFKDLQPVFLAGPGEDAAPFRAYKTLAGAPLSETKALLANATLFIGNDSGPAHMAAAFGVPSVVLFGLSDPIVWAPWRVPSEVITTDGPIDSISVDRVAEAAEALRVAQ